MLLLPPTGLVKRLHRLLGMHNPLHGHLLWESMGCDEVSLPVPGTFLVKFKLDGLRGLQPKRKSINYRILIR